MTQRLAVVSKHEDARMRLKAFAHVEGLQRIHDYLTGKELGAGFTFEGERIPLVNPQRGIFKPRKMRYLLSIRTVFPVPGRKIWYDDQRQIHRQIYEGDDTVEYAFMGKDPEAPDNVWLFEAFKDQIPVIYYLGIAPRRYQAILPAFISGWDAKALQARVAFGSAISAVGPHQEVLSVDQVPKMPSSVLERRYALRSVKQRLHQASFREAVISAYRGRCAISAIPEPKLLDAAHIVSDKDECFGQAIVRNGIPLSKIHHAAFDAHLIGIDPDYRLHVSDRLRDREDGPLLESLKGIEGRKIHLPARILDRPDRDRLAMRFELYRAAG